nr:putative bifunctional protein: zinc-containing alcohol dehydrogenase; quinone oxidoreductase [uncultured bacterium]
MAYKKIVLQAFGGPEQLTVVEEPQLPEPAAGEVRVKVLAAGTGFTDTIVRQGQYVDVKEKPPFVPGYDWFGVVDKVGEGVLNFAEGDYVADMPVIGGYTEYLCVAVDQLVKAPAGLDPAEAVAMILSYTTAYQMLTRIRDIKPGSSALVHAAGGAVGSALLELCRLQGLVVYGTASAGKKDLVEGFGATHIDYRRDKFEKTLMASEPDGVDVVFDTLGGKSWSRSYKCLQKGGLLVAYGALQLTTGEEKLPSLILGFAKLGLLWKLIPDGKQAIFYNIQRRRDSHPEEFKADVSALFELLAEGKLKPAIAKRMSLTQAADAHRRIDKADVEGKIVLVNSQS